MIDISCHGRLDRAISAMVRDTLTVVDGSFTDLEQRNAVKRLIKKAIYNSMDDFRLDLVENFGLPPLVREDR